MSISVLLYKKNMKKFWKLEFLSKGEEMNRKFILSFVLLFLVSIAHSAYLKELDTELINIFSSDDVIEEAYLTDYFSGGSDTIYKTDYLIKVAFSGKRYEINDPSGYLGQGRSGDLYLDENNILRININGLQGGLEEVDLACAITKHGIEDFGLVFSEVIQYSYSDYFPLDQGFIYYYSIGKGLHLRHFVPSSKTYGGKHAILSETFMSNKGKLSFMNSATLVDNGIGIKCKATENMLGSKKQTDFYILKGPMSIGTSWVDRSGDNSEIVSLDGIYGEYENCLVVETSYYLSEIKKHSFTYDWYAPNIGLIASTSTTGEASIDASRKNVVMELTTKTSKK